MIIDRYDPVNLFRLVPQLQLEMEPELAALDKLLDDDVLFQRVKADLSRRYPQSARRGRPSTPVEVILRMLAVQHLYDWRYDEAEHAVNDSLVLRQFCRLYLEKAPDDTTLIRWANQIQPETLHALLARVVELARTNKVTRGRKLRTDGTVVETTIHYPTDSSLLGDGVRVLSRTLRKARQVLGETADRRRQLFRDRTRSAKQQVKRILDATRQRGQQAEAAMRDAYQHLLETTQALVKQARQVGAALQEQPSRAARKVAETLETFIPRVEQVMAQTTRRVLQGETVPANEKVVSLFEPETAIIRKGKIANATEFGRLIWLDEVEGGSSVATTYWTAIPPRRRRCRAVWIITWRCLSVHRICWRGIGAPTRPTMNAMPRNSRSSRWCCPSRGRNRKRGRHTNDSRGSGAVGAGGRGSKGASAG
jgi:transposase, IS5 family